MKRFLVTTILTVVVAGVLTLFMPRSFETYLPKFDARATVTIYCRQTTLQSIDMGSGCGYKVQCDTQSYASTAALCKGIDGVSVSFVGDYADVAELWKFFRLQVTSTYEQDGLLIVCGKSPKIRGGVMDGNDIVNLQIAYKDGLIHLGSPLILGDY